MPSMCLSFSNPFTLKFLLLYYIPLSRNAHEMNLMETEIFVEAMANTDTKLRNSANILVVPSAVTKCKRVLQ